MVLLVGQISVLLQMVISACSIPIGFIPQPNLVQSWVVLGTMQRQFLMHWNMQLIICWMRDQPRSRRILQNLVPLHLGTLPESEEKVVKKHSLILGRRTAILPPWQYQI